MLKAARRGKDETSPIGFDMCKGGFDMCKDGFGRQSLRGAGERE